MGTCEAIMKAFYGILLHVASASQATSVRTHLHRRRCYCRGGADRRRLCRRQVIWVKFLGRGARSIPGRHDLVPSVASSEFVFVVWSVSYYREARK